MEKVALGKTGLVVTRLGWGGIPIQRVEEAEAVAVIREVIGMGVDLLDTARGYTTSERRVGLAIQAARKRVVISTKSQERTAAIYDDVLESLKQLQVNKIDIYNVHGVQTFDDYEKILAPGGAYEGLVRARNEGLVDHLGITSHSLDVLARAAGEGHYEVMMAAYSFLEPAAEEKVFPLARANGMGILAMKPFSGGVIEDAGPALRYVLAAPDVVPIPGSETAERARENWKIFTGGRPLSDEDRKTIEAVRRQYDKRFCRRCDYCQPCTESIPIQHVLGARSLWKRGMGVQQGRIAQTMEKARSCTECGACLPRCPYGLPIPDLIKENLAWWDSVVGS